MLKLIAAAALGSMALGACSTVQTRRDDPPTFTASTPKTLEQFQTCFAEQFDKADQGPAYLPKEHGGTYTMRIGVMQNYVYFVLDIQDDGNSRSIILHAANSMWGKDKKLIAKVERCI